MGAVVPDSAELASHDPATWLLCSGSRIDLLSVVVGSLLEPFYFNDDLSRERRVALEDAKLECVHI